MIRVFAEDTMRNPRRERERREAAEREGVGLLDNERRALQGFRGSSKRESFCEENFR